MERDPQGNGKFTVEKVFGFLHELHIRVGWAFSAGRLIFVFQIDGLDQLNQIGDLMAVQRVFVMFG